MPIFADLSPAAVQFAGGRYFGFVTGATMANFTALAAAQGRMIAEKIPAVTGGSMWTPHSDYGPESLIN